MGASEFVFARLNGQTPAGNRIYPMILPQQPVYPAVTYNRIGWTRIPTMGSESTIARVRMQLNCWGSTYGEAIALAEAVRSRLTRFRGDVNGTQVLDVIFENYIEQYEPSTRTLRVIRDCTIYLGN